MRFLLAVVAIIILFPAAAYAACLVPNGNEGDLVYNSTYKVVQFCNGTQWVSTGGSTDTLATLSCANGEIAKWNGTTWACAADASGMSGLPALTAANIWVGNGSNAATAVSMSGDGTLSNAGILTIGSNAIGSAEITNASVALADLSATGTASATTYLRGDNTWATISGADNLGDHIATTVLRSDTHNTDDLGTTAIRWKDGWFAGTITGGTFAGSGASLTSLPAANLTGTLPAISGANLTSLNATNLGSGTVAAARLPAFTGDVTVAAGTTTTVIAANAVTTAEILDGTILAADLAAGAGADNLGNHIATTVLRSDTTNTDDLGTTAIRWKDGWFQGTVTATTFAGSGASLTALPAANLTGTLPAISGVNLTALNATNLGSGTVPVARLGASGTASTATFLRGDNTWSSTIVGSITATSFLYSSDARLKADIEEIGNARDKLAGIHGVTYYYKADENRTPKLGVLAQDVKKVFPQAVATDSNGMMAVDYPALVPVLIEAVNELSAEVKALKAELHAEKQEDH